MTPDDFRNMLYIVGGPVLLALVWYLVKEDRERSSKKDAQVVAQISAASASITDMVERVTRNEGKMDALSERLARAEAEVSVLRAEQSRFQSDVLPRLIADSIKLHTRISA